MAVVISQSQNEIADMAERGTGHQAPPQADGRGALEGKFKDPQDPFRIAFVCSMWTTGFDVPSLSTVYLDKPMRNHTLMQTITRANRVFPDKNNGLIVAYVDVFRNLQKALAIYAIGSKPGDVPVEEKGALVDASRGRRMTCERSAQSGTSTSTISASHGVRAGRGRQADGRDAHGG